MANNGPYHPKMKIWRAANDVIDRLKILSQAELIELPVVCPHNNAQHKQRTE